MPLPGPTTSTSDVAPGSGTHCGSESIGSGRGVGGVPCEGDRAGNHAGAIGRVRRRGAAARCAAGAELAGWFDSPHATPAAASHDGDRQDATLALTW